MILIASLWLCLCLPGYALLRRFAPEALAGGGLSSIALGYLASFALLSPFSISGYALHLPLAVLTSAIVGAVAVAGGFLLWTFVRAGMRSWRVPRLSTLGLIAVLCAGGIAIDMVLGLRAGAFFQGDAQYHMARVRMLSSYGFNSWDPLVPGHKLDLVYHSNLYHAVMASFAQLSGQPAPVVWAHTWFWAKLFCAGATYHLAFCVLGKRVFAWIAAATFALWMAPSSTLLYPNTVASLGLLALALAFTVELLAEAQPSRSALFGLAASALVLVQFHALYYIFAVLIAGPLLGVRLLRVLRWKLPGARELALACLLLAIGSPWFAVRAYARVHQGARTGVAAAQAAAPAAPEHTRPSEPAWSYKGFVHLEHGLIALDPSSLYDPRSPVCQLWIALIAGVFTRRRPQVVALAAAAGVVALVLYVPLICTMADRLVGGAWIVRRLSAVQTSAHLALFPCAFGLLVQAWLRRERSEIHPLLAAGALIAALSLAYTSGVNAQPWSRASYLAKSEDGGYARGRLGRFAATRRLFTANIPRDAVVAVTLNRVYDLAISCDCSPLALPTKRGTRGIDDMAARQAAVALVLNPNAPLATRVDALRHYGVHHLVLHRGYAASALARSYRPFRVEFAGAAGVFVVTVDWDHKVKKRGR